MFAPHAKTVPSPKHSPTIDRRVLEEIKLRAPVEDVVLERVPELKRSGSLLVACCPFHEEKTPSFKVDPRRGTWHCYGSCSRGGDQISFVMEFDRVDFRDAVEILAAKTGVELRAADPERRQTKREDDEARAVLARAERFFARRLTTDEGQAARAYLESRGITGDVLEAFGLGWAPAGGRVLVDEARRSGASLERLEETGLMRRTDSGRPYDFFRGRLMIPIRDERGRTVGFGARRLHDDAEAGPKYINTPETRLFHKGRLIYGLDQAMNAARREGHLILVEGYTDVIAAVRAGLHNVGAVLGTATTEEHAGLVRRAGARRVSLVFDGDEAGKRAALRALHGLLPLDIEIRVAVLPTGVDPCDALSPEDGDFERARAEFCAQLDAAPDWFDFLLADLEGLRGHELSNGVDTLLEVLLRLSKPVHKEARLSELAERLKLPIDSLREQWRELPARRRAENARRRAAQDSSQDSNRATSPAQEHSADGARNSAPATHVATESQSPSPNHPEASPRPAKTERRVLHAFGGMLGAVLCDTSLVPLLQAHRHPCPAPELAPVLEAILALYEREAPEIDADHVMTELGEDPTRTRVVPILEYARRAESPTLLFEEGARFLTQRHLEREREELYQRISEAEARVRDPREDVAESAQAELTELMRRMEELVRPLTGTARTNNGLSPLPN